MENESAVPSFSLNYDCAFELLLWLGFEDCMNMAEAYEGLQSIADRVYKKKFNKLAFDFQQPIDRILYHAGPTAKSLTLTFCTFDNNLQSDLVKIVDTCKELRCLTINKLNAQNLVNSPLNRIVTKHLEMLTLNRCCLANDADFFDGYEKLKYLNLIECQKIELVAMKKCFERNPEITSFVCNIQHFFHPTLLQLLPNLEKLSLRYNSRYMKLDVLSQLRSLGHLTLVCLMQNVNDVLADLGTVDRLEELVLVDVATDENTFPLIKSLQNLKLLVAMTDGCRFPSSSDLPPKIKALKLGGCDVADNDIASTVKHLKHLEALHLQNCELERNGFWIRDFDSLADFVIDEVVAERAHRQLSVTVVSLYDQTPEVIYIKETSNDEFGGNYKNSFILQTIVIVGRLRITNFDENSKLFKISHPGVDN